MDKYKYTYETTPDYCYPNTDILINKLNIKNAKKLYIAERDFVSYRVTILMRAPVKGNFDFEHLKKIHAYLFQDIYSWAGTPRRCNIAKTNLFCLAQFIDSYAENVFAKIAKKGYFIGLSHDEKLKALTNIFADINALHPFREGNGRTQREFIKGLAGINGIALDFTQVDSMEMIIASSESVNGNTEKLSAMFTRIATRVGIEEQLEYIDKYILDKKLKEALKIAIE